MISREYQIISKPNIEYIIDIIDKWDEYFRKFYYNAGLFTDPRIRLKCFNEINEELTILLKEDNSRGGTVFNQILEMVGYFEHYELFKQSFCEKNCRTYNNKPESYERFYGASLMQLKIDLDEAYEYYIRQFYDDFEL